MSAQVQVGTLCRRCSQFRHPREFVGGPFGYCLYCYEKHQKALAYLEAHGVPTECDVCRVATAQLAARDGQAKLQLHYKDGGYAILCNPCGDKYAQQRRDLYGKTPFALAHGIQ